MDFELEKELLHLDEVQQQAYLYGYEQGKLEGRKELVKELQEAEEKILAEENYVEELRQKFPRYTTNPCPTDFKEPV